MSEIAQGDIKPYFKTLDGVEVFHNTRFYIVDLKKSTLQKAKGNCYNKNPERYRKFSNLELAREELRLYSLTLSLKDVENFLRQKGIGEVGIKTCIKELSKP